MKTARLLLIVGGILCTIFGLHEALIARVWRARPHEMACAELARRGPGDNAHIRLNDFVLAADHPVHEDDVDGTWRRVWIPAFPKLEVSAPDHAPTAFRVLVRSQRVKDPEALARLARSATLDGFVVNDIETLGSHELQRLEDAYPHTQIDRCWILDHERKPMSSITAEVLVVGGLLAFGLGFWLLVRGRRKRADPLTVVARSAPR